MERKNSGVNTILMTGMVVLLIIIAYQLSVVNSSMTGLASGLQETKDVKDTVDAAAKPSEQAEPTQPAQPGALNMESLMDDDAIEGDPDAPVTIVEWSDFQCPFCARFYAESYKTIKAEYIDTGKVKFVFRDFPLSFHANAQKAAEAAECAGEQGKYYEMHDQLFENGVSGGVASFKQYAADIGLDQDKFDSCLDNGDMVDEIQQDTSDGIAAGIKGTPGFIINGQLVSGAQPIAVFKQIIDAKLGE